MSKFLDTDGLSYLWSKIVNKINTTFQDATTKIHGLMSASDKEKLDGIESGAQKNTVTSVAGKTGTVTLSKEDVGLDSVDNTADKDKEVGRSFCLTTYSYDSTTESALHHDAYYRSSLAQYLEDYESSKFPYLMVTDDETENNGDGSYSTTMIRLPICDVVYPVGSIYMSLKDTSPAELFGGTWEQVESGETCGGLNKKIGTVVSVDITYNTVEWNWGTYNKTLDLSQGTWIVSCMADFSNMSKTYRQLQLVKKSGNANIYPYYDAAYYGNASFDNVMNEGVWTVQVEDNATFSPYIHTYVTKAVYCHFVAVLVGSYGGDSVYKWKRVS